MDYAIYKTNDGKHPRIVHTFTQEATGHHAKIAARKKLNDMWLRVLNQPSSVQRNAKGENDTFQYDYMTSANTHECIRFYIAPLLQNDKQSSKVQ